MRAFRYLETAEKRLGSVAALRRDERGSIMAWTALGIIGMVGMAALSVDMGYMYVLKTQLQATADAAASAAAKELPSSTNAFNAAQSIALANMPSSAHGNVITASDVEVGNWDTGTKVFTAGGSPTNAVRVTAHRDSANANSAKTFFATVLGTNEVALNSSAIALQGTTTGAPPCLLALDGSSNLAFTMNSNANINITGCGVYVNSSDPSALELNANAHLSAESICVNGGFEDDVNTTVSPTPSTGSSSCPQVSDPLYGIFHSPGSEPTPGVCPNGNKNVTIGGPPNGEPGWKPSGTPLTPGTYCGGIVMVSNSNTTLLPGIYILKDSVGIAGVVSPRAGVLHLNSNSIMNGTGGVFIFITGQANVGGTYPNPIVDLNSNSQLNLVAMSSGAYAGVVIYQDDALVGLTNRLNSNSNKRFVGAVYFPNGDVLVDSNGSINFNSACSLFIARRFQFDSNAGLTGNFDLSTGCSQQIADLLQGIGGGPGTTTTLVK